MNVLFCEKCQLCPQLYRGEKPVCPHCGGKLSGGSSKYKNKKTVVNGITFDSKKEAAHYLLLQHRLRMGEIRGLRTQVAYHFVINGVKVASYKADFVYIEGGETIVEDVKGMRTRVYSIKKKLMRAIHGITIKEV